MFGNEKRGQSIMVAAFFVVILIGVFILVQMTSRYDQPKQIEPGTAREIQEQNIKDAETVLKNSLIIPMEMASYESAQNGFEAPNSYLISYGVKTLPPLSAAQDALGTKAAGYCNQYLDKLKNSGKEFSPEYNFIETGSVGTIRLWFDEVNLSNRDVDTGFSFSPETIDGEEVTGDPAIQSKIETGGETKTIEGDFTLRIDNIRYWYLYRTVRGWIEQGILIKEACNRLPIVKGNASDEAAKCYAPYVADNIVENTLSNATHNLNQRFDNKVTCSYKILCQNVETELLWKHPCPAGVGCIAWPCKWYQQNATACIVGGCGDNPECENPVNAGEPPCQDTGSVNYTSEWVYGTGQEIVASRVSKGIYPSITYSENHTVSFIANMTCVDKSYNHPDFGNLKLNFLVHVYMVRGEDADDPPCPCLIGGSSSGGGTDRMPNEEDEDKPKPSEIIKIPFIG
ncbi:hypothetical protein JXA85_02745 [Candidatus Woesearchaeota archaeon]|nr:hypothetical protein [Candidatus Woesearchaeota archaeon]